MIWGHVGACTCDEMGACTLLLIQLTETWREAVIVCRTPFSKRS